MNTQTHVLVGWIAATALRPSPKAMAAVWIAAIAGGILPDLSMVLMVAVESALGTPMQAVWNEAYYRMPWTLVDAMFNSLPLYAAIALLGAVVLRAPWVLALGLSGSLHVLLDLPVHASDAHAHFWPLTMWKFESPFSYWESGKGAGAILALEVVFGALGCWWLWTRRELKHLGWRVIIVFLSLIYLLFAVMGIWFAINGTPWD